MKNCVLILFVTTALLYANGLKTFQAGTPIVSADVNSNFATLENNKVDKVHHEYIEQATGLLWFGKPIYRMSIQINNPISSGEHVLATLTEIDKVIHLSGTSQLIVDGGDTYPFNLTNNNDSPNRAWLRYLPSNKTLQIFNHGWVLHNACVIIEYTKK